jgi:hypothetical protein
MSNVNNDNRETIDINKRENAYIYFKDKYIFSLKISGI